MGRKKGFQVGFHVALNFGKLREMIILLKQLSTTVQRVLRGVYFRLMLLVEALYFIAGHVFYTAKNPCDYYELAKYHRNEQDKYLTTLKTYQTKRQKKGQKVQQRQNQNDQNEIKKNQIQ